MSFRRKHHNISNPSDRDSVNRLSQLGGIRPSPVDGRPTTSTGLHSFDDLFGGHAALPLGCSLMIEERDTSDYGGILLRFFAAEGIVQGHQLHVVGMSEHWSRFLPGLADHQDVYSSSRVGPGHTHDQKMKIAWRYEKPERPHIVPEASLVPQLTDTAKSEEKRNAAADPFCHFFDMTKPFSIISTLPINSISINLASPPQSNVLSSLFEHLASAINSSSSATVHRVIIPSFLSPAIYPMQSCEAAQILRFLCLLRSLLRRHSQRLSVILTIPLSLHTRNSGMVRWVENLCDGVMEIMPLLYGNEIGPAVINNTMASASSETKDLDHPQGLLRVHKLPVITEKSGGATGENFAFRLDRRHLLIGKYHLPPVTLTPEGQSAASIDQVLASKFEF